MLICRPWRKSACFPLPHSRSRLPLSGGWKAILLETQGSCSPGSRRAQAASSTVSLANPPLPLPSSSRKGKRQDRTSKPTSPLPLFLGELKQKVRFCDSVEREEGGGSKELRVPKLSWFADQTHAARSASAGAPTPRGPRGLARSRRGVGDRFASPCAPGPRRRSYKEGVVNGGGRSIKGVFFSSFGRLVSVWEIGKRLGEERATESPERVEKVIRKPVHCLQLLICLGWCFLSAVQLPSTFQLSGLLDRRPIPHPSVRAPLNSSSRPSSTPNLEGEKFWPRVVPAQEL
ncbi:uncharacterized protein LOC122673290 [Cervus elaphus]|uniref:uncharacterized protein LOC122673290 n=1 Tax=Cervus elaphus TaxID=9860 RepID=UPI001CC2BE7C|nr:uncharacterized protein LOC122673290 [Cervus elaphus]